MAIFTKLISFIVPYEPVILNGNYLEYMKLRFFPGETTAGTMAVIDLDGDGYTEIVSAGYTAGTVYVHTFAPEKH
jgi:hypothetical protein